MTEGPLWGIPEAILIAARTAMMTSLPRFGATRRRSFLIIIALLVGAVCLMGEPQKPSKPLSKEEVITLLKGEVPAARIEDLAREKGIAFPLTPQVENELRGLGATDSLMQAMKAVAPRGTPIGRASSNPGRTAQVTAAGGRAAAPVLLVQSSPGGARVYLDDEPIGTTSAAGVLKHSHLSAGEHHLRVALSEYQDYEENIELQTGETLRVTANLTPGSSGPVSGSPSFAAPQVRPGDAYFAALGIVTPENQPSDYTVVDVLEVAAGSPAEQAGLRSACTILSLAGVRVTSPQQLQLVLSQHRAGETVEITFNDGSLVHPARVGLARNTPAPRGASAR